MKEVKKKKLYIKLECHLTGPHTLSHEVSTLYIYIYILMILLLFMFSIILHLYLIKFLISISKSVQKFLFHLLSKSCIFI